MPDTHGAALPPRLRFGTPPTMDNRLIAALALSSFFAACNCADAGLWESPADIENPITFGRDNFTVQHPGNWTVDSSGLNQDAGQLSIESPGDCLVMLTFLPTKFDQQDIRDRYIEEFGVLLSNAKQTPFGHWGQYDGAGMKLTGTLVILPGSFRIFTHSQSEGGFVVVEQCYDEDMDNVRPGFEQVERTFRFHPR